MAAYEDIQTIIVLYNSFLMYNLNIALLHNFHIMQIYLYIKTCLCITYPFSYIRYLVLLVIIVYHFLHLLLNHTCYTSLLCICCLTIPVIPAYFHSSHSLSFLNYTSLPMLYTIKFILLTILLSLYLLHYYTTTLFLLLRVGVWGRGFFLLCFIFIKIMLF